jgi:hypothetical protein
MVINRTSTLLMGLILLLLLAPSNSQAQEEYGVPIGDMQWFAPRDISSYGTGPPPNEGFFFTADYLTWSVPAPASKPIGLDFVVFPSGDVFDHVADTSEMNNELTSGFRGEVGWIEDSLGFQVSGFKLDGFNQNITYPSGTSILMFEPADYLAEFGAIPAQPIYQNVSANNRTQLWGMETMGIWRKQPVREAWAPIFELMGGFRYMELDEQYSVLALFDELAGESYWYTNGMNRMVGPQIGARLSKQKGQFRISMDTRFFSAWNFQTVSHRSGFNNSFLYDSVFPPAIPSDAPTATTATDHEVEWTPTGELRLEMAYVVTRKVVVRAGWTGLWMGNGIVRAAEKVDYTNDAPITGITSSILPGNNKENFFAQGINLGVEINR